MVTEMGTINGHARHIGEKNQGTDPARARASYLTYGTSMMRYRGADSPEDLDEIYVKLRSLEIEIVDQAEVDRVKQVEEEEEKTRLDILTIRCGCI